MAVKFTDTKYYQEIADAIRAKTGSTLKMTPSEMATEIGNIPAGGDDQIIKYLKGQEIGDVDDSTITKIPENALIKPMFNNFKIPNCRKIGYHSLVGIYISGDYDFSEVTEIAGFAFSKNGSQYSLNSGDGSIGIVDLVLPKCQTIEVGAFNNLSYKRADGTAEPRPLKTVSAPLCTRIEHNVFRAPLDNTGALESVSFPIVTYVGDSTFVGNTRLESFETEGELTYIGGQLFSGCSGLKRFSAKNTSFRTALSTYVFRDCTSLEYADVGSVHSLLTECFKNCTSLNYLILRRTQGSTPYTTMSNSNALSTSRLATGEGFILVPSSLMETYKTATNWSLYAGQFRALEDYTVDGTITGDLDETKLENIA